MEDQIEFYISKPKAGGTGRLDPRTKLGLLVGTGIFSFFINGDIPALLLVITTVFFISSSGNVKGAAKMLLVYLIICWLSSLLRYLTVPVLSMIMAIFSVNLMKLIPIIIMARWVFDTVYLDDLMAALTRMRIPQIIIIPMVVVIRYIPTLSMEYQMILNTMKIRGICDTWGKRVKHPLMTIEYILIPLLTRCLKVADELAASGTTRGLGKNNYRYSPRKISFSLCDSLTLVGGLSWLCFLLIMDGGIIGEVILWGN